MANLISDEALARISSVVRWFESQGPEGPPNRKGGYGSAQPLVICRITAETTAGEYETEEVRWFDDELALPTSKDWQTVVGGKTLTVQEINGTEGIEIGTVIFAEMSTIFFTPATGTDPYKPRAQWVFQIGGSSIGGVPCEITSKVSGNEYLANVYENGRYDDAGVPQSATQAGVTLFIWQVSSSKVIPAGTFLLAVPVENHFEGQVPVWL